MSIASHLVSRYRRHRRSCFAWGLLPPVIAAHGAALAQTAAPPISQHNFALMLTQCRGLMQAAPKLSDPRSRHAFETSRDIIVTFTDTLWMNNVITAEEKQDNLKTGVDLIQSGNAEGIGSAVENCLNMANSLAEAVKQKSASDQTKPAH